MKKAKIFISFIVIAIIPILLYFMSIKFFYKSLAIKNGNHIVNSIEKYRTEKGHLPDSFNDINLVTDDFWGGMATKRKGIKYYYEKMSDSDYKVYFDYNLGDSITYMSETKDWY